MKFLALAAATLSILLASPVQAGYPVKTDTLNCRKSASLSAAIVKTYKKGNDITIKCQTTGPTVDGSNIWDKTQDNCFVADVYVKTGHSGFVPGIAKCPGTPSGGAGQACKGVNTKTLNHIKASEGWRASPYKDPVGYPTVGYGHLCQSSSCSEVGPFPLTRARGEALLKKDVQKFTKCVAAMLKDTVKLNDNQFGALVSWAFNLGCEQIKTSQLIKRLNNGENPNTVASQELPKWNKAGKPPKPLEGLTRRRKAEVALFKTASSKQAHPKCE